MWYIDRDSKTWLETEYPYLTKTFLIPWHNGRLVGVRRLRLNTNLPMAELIEAEAARIGLPIVTDFSDLSGLVGELWIGLRTCRGYRGHPDDRDKLLECDDAEFILACLREAKPAVKRWAIKSYNGGQFVQNETGTVGSVETAKSFASQEEAYIFQQTHDVSGYPVEGEGLPN